MFSFLCGLAGRYCEGVGVTDPVFAQHDSSAAKAIIIIMSAAKTYFATVCCHPDLANIISESHSMCVWPEQCKCMFVTLAVFIVSLQWILIGLHNISISPSTAFYTLGKWGPSTSSHTRVLHSLLSICYSLIQGTSTSKQHILSQRAHLQSLMNTLEFNEF